MLDDLVDLEIEKVDAQLFKIIENDPESEELKRVERDLWLKIRARAVNGRRTGLGVTGEGDMLAAMNLKYGSEESIEFVKAVHKTITKASYKTSVQLAKERGRFPLNDVDLDSKSSFLNRVYGELDVDTQSSWYMNGRRNIACNTLAPTGTVSLMTQTTSGIEPLYEPYYKRKTRVEDKSKATFVDEMGDGWAEYLVLHPKFVDWYKLALENSFADFEVWYDGCSFEREEIESWLSELPEGLLKVIFEWSPYYKATANDVDWKASVKMQGAIQKWIDHSISKTVNIPKHITVEEVDEIYRAAYKAGCKGCTIYRDGSRSGVLTSIKKESSNKFEYSKAFKRPKVTECDIYHKTALKQEWVVLVGKVNGNPYEVFVLKNGDSFPFPEKIEKGKITKVKSKHYRLEGVLDDKVYTVDNIVNLMADDERVNTRKYSAMLRHGMHPKFIAEQISEYANIVSFDKVVQRVLKNYISEEEEIKPLCPQCGSANYYSKESCWSCPDCGYEACG